MTSLIGLLLHGTPEWRNELALRWGVEVDDGSGLVTGIFRCITNVSALRSFVAGLPIEQRMVLDAVVSSRVSPTPMSILFSKLPFDREVARAAVSELKAVALLVGDDAHRVAVTADLLLPLRGLLSGRSCPEARHSDKAVREHLPSRLPTRPLRIAARPSRVLPAVGGLLLDIRRLLEAPSNKGFHESGREGRHSEVKASPSRLYARRCVEMLGLLSRRGSSPVLEQWQALGEDGQRKAVLECWLSDRGWHDEACRASATAKRLRYDRLRHRIRTLLSGVPVDQWWSIRSLIERARSASFDSALPIDRRSKGDCFAVAFTVILANGFHSLGLVDLGFDCSGRLNAFSVPASARDLLNEKVTRNNLPQIGEGDQAWATQKAACQCPK